MLSIYVKSDASGNNSGSSWENAFTNLKDAIDAINNSADSNMSIFVAKGIYVPGSAQNESFSIGTKMKLYGGFAGNETSFTQNDLNNRNYELNETIISGDINNNDNGSTDSKIDNTYILFRVDASGSISNKGILFDGFTIKSSYNPVSNGGAFFANNTELNIRNTKFIDNESGLGGAIFSESYFGKARELNVENCEFYNNLAGEAAGIFCKNNNLKLSNSTFINNSTTYGFGSAIYFNSSNEWDVTAKLTNVTAAYNPSYFGGSLYFGGFSNNQFKSNVNLTNVLVWGNKMTDSTFQFENYQVHTAQDVGVTTVVGNCLIEGSGGSDNWIGSNIGINALYNLDENPLMKNPTLLSNVLHLNSPAIGKGDINFGKNIGSYQGNGEDFEIYVDGIDENNEFSIYPNPTHDYCVISIDGFSKNSNVIVRDVLGNVVLTQNNSNIINLQNLNSGLYFIEMRKNNKVHIQNIIKN